MMGMRLLIAVEWIRADCGGRRLPPTVGLRPTVRWQRHVAEWLSGAWDAEIVEIAPLSTERVGEAVLRFSDGAEISPEWTRAGELIELLDGPRVIGVGVLRAVV